MTYKNVIEQIQKDNVCPFCPDQLAKYHKKPILREGSFWTVTTNMYPYPNTKHHFLMILKAHKADSKDLSPEEWTELHDHINWLVTSYNIPGGTFFMRCGDTSLTGATVTHLHSHFVSADFENPNRKPIMARVG
jgi:diadenosine tetraphosphate (Ap4A) HIT family hydrolase